MSSAQRFAVVCSVIGGRISCGGLQVVVSEAETHKTRRLTPRLSDCRIVLLLRRTGGRGGVDCRVERRGLRCDHSSSRGCSTTEPPPAQRHV